MSRSTALEPVLADAMHRLEQTLEALATRLRQETDYPIWGWKTEDPAEARRRAIQLLMAIDYVDGQHPSESRIYPALIGTSRETLEVAYQVNVAKRQLEQALRAFGRDTVPVTRPDGSVVRMDRLRHALANLGHLRLHKVQAVRKIVICDTSPYRVGYTWAVRTARVERTDRETLIAQLQRRIDPEYPSDPGLFEDLERLRSLPPGEPLAIYRRPQCHPRVNLAFRIDGEVVRKLRPAVMPILYPATRGAPLPKLRPLEVDPPNRRRARRSDRRVNEERFLRTEPVHRYLPATDIR